MQVVSVLAKNLDRCQRPKAVAHPSPLLLSHALSPTVPIIFTSRNSSIAEYVFRSFFLPSKLWNFVGRRYSNHHRVYDQVYAKKNPGKYINLYFVILFVFLLPILEQILSELNEKPCPVSTFWRELFETSRPLVFEEQTKHAKNRSWLPWWHHPTVGSFKRDNS